MFYYIRTYGSMIIAAGVLMFVLQRIPPLLEGAAQSFDSTPLRQIPIVHDSLSALSYGSSDLNGQIATLAANAGLTEQVNSVSSTFGQIFYSSYKFVQTNALKAGIDIPNAHF